MATSVVAYEFRCTRCYQVIQLSTDLEGTQLPCPWCQTLLQAPEANGRLSPVAAPAVSPASAAAPERPSIDELKACARQRAKSAAGGPSVRCHNPARMSASRLSRLGAITIDMVAFMIAHFLGIIPTLVLSFTDVINRPTMVAYAEFACRDIPIALITKNWRPVQSAASYFSPSLWLLIVAANSIAVLFLLFQAYSVATRGQSVGKRLMRIKIVNGSGDTPGFATGVLIRSCGINAVGIVSAFVLVGWPAAFLRLLVTANIMAICLEPPRCLHDRIAGTYVIRA